MFCDLKMTLISSDLPISSMGPQDADDVLFIRFGYSIEQLLPEPKPYYLKTTQNLIHLISNFFEMIRK